MSNDTLPSVKTNKAKVKQKQYSKAHMIIPTEDMNWALQQKPSVIKLWQECWIADGYGSRWMQLNTSLKRTAFTEAKKVLEEQGLFIFRPTKSIRDSRETVCWSVKNLHGARVKEYWESTESASANNNTANANNNTANANNNTANANSISSKSLTEQGSCNLSVTSQEHLTNSSKEFVRCEDPVSSENLLSHLEAAVRGVLPSKGIIYQLRDSRYWVNFTGAARVHGWDLRELLAED